MYQCRGQLARLPAVQRHWLAGLGLLGSGVCSAALQGRRCPGGAGHPEASRVCLAPRCPGSAGQNQGWNEPHGGDPKYESCNRPQGSWVPAPHSTGGESSTGPGTSQGPACRLLICRPVSEALSQEDPRDRAEGSSCDLAPIPSLFSLSSSPCEGLLP